MKVLVTGAGGLLAHDVMPVLAAAGHEVRGIDEADADVTNLDALLGASRAFRPDWIFHFAAYTRVDDCETQRDRAFLVNGLGSRNAALAAADGGAAILAVSSDYVFDGEAKTAYREYDAARPLSVYGASKWAGEQAVREAGAKHVIVRTAWLFGRGGGNFVDAILKKARAGEALKVVGDQRGSPTCAADLARGLLRLAERAAYGTYHVVNGGDASWHELAEAALLAAGSPAKVARIGTAELGRPAPRPAYSVLDASWFSHVAGEGLPHWSEALARHVRASREAS